jgi:hypothetical protein
MPWSANTAAPAKRVDTAEARAAKIHDNLPTVEDLTDPGYFPYRSIAPRRVPRVRDQHRRRPAGEPVRVCRCGVQRGAAAGSSSNDWAFVFNLRPGF